MWQQRAQGNQYGVPVICIGYNVGGLFTISCIFVVISGILLRYRVWYRVVRYRVKPDIRPEVRASRGMSCTYASSMVAVCFKGPEPGAAPPYPQLPYLLPLPTLPPTPPMSGGVGGVCGNDADGP